MIAVDSKSYPYLAIAQHHNVPYAEVLKCSEFYRQYFNQSPPYTAWRLLVWHLEHDKQKSND